MMMMMTPSTERSLNGSPNLGPDPNRRTPLLPAAANFTTASFTTDSLVQPIQSALRRSLRLQAKIRPNYRFPERSEIGSTRSPFEEEEDHGYRSLRSMEPACSRTETAFKRGSS